MNDIIIIQKPTPAHKVLVGDIIQHYKDPKRIGVIKKFKGQDDQVKYFGLHNAICAPVPMINDDTEYTDALNNWVVVDLYEIGDLRNLSVGDWVLTYVQNEYRIVLVTNNTKFNTVEGKYSRVFHGGSELKSVTLNMINIIGKVLKTTNLDAGVEQTLKFMDFEGETGKAVTIFTDEDIVSVSKTHKRNLINL